MNTNSFYIVTTKTAVDDQSQYNQREALTLLGGRTISVEINHYFETLTDDRVVRSSKLFDGKERALKYAADHYDKDGWTGIVEIMAMRREILCCGCPDGWCDCNI